MILNIYDESYYIVYRDYEFNEYSNKLISTEYSASTNWKFKKLDYGIKPLTYMSKNENLDFLTNEYVVCFDVPNFVVTKKLKDMLESGVFGCQFFPAIVLDEHGNFVEDLWALNTFEELDCIDMNRSEHYMPNDGSTEIDGFKIHADMDTYRFREDVLDSIPEEKRLIFQVSSTSKGEIFVHQKVVDIFTKHNVKGIKFYKASEFEDGDQHFSYV